MFKLLELQKSRHGHVILIMFAIFIAFSLSVTTAFARDLDEVNGELQEAKNNEAAAKKELQDIRNNIAALTTKIKNTEAAITTTEKEIENAIKEAERLTVEVAALEVEIDGENDNLNSRLRVMYQSNEESILVVLLGSENIVDFFSNLEMVKLIHKSGTDLIEELDRKLKQIEDKKVELEQIQVNLEAQKVVQEERAVELAVDKEALAVEEDKAAKNAAAAHEHTASLQAESNRMAAELAAREAQKKAQKEAEKQAAVQAGESEEKVKEIENKYEYSGGGMAWPCQGTVTSEYGQRWGSLHAGIDIANSAGTPIRAASDGEVFYSQWNSGGYGYQVRIDHGGGIVTTYAHNSSLACSPGQYVKKGTVIAYMGTTGDSTGNHCHFEVRVNGVAQNPRNWL